MQQIGTLTTESVNRKACNRCHAQKLSCKRSNNAACERCLRLNTDCEYSPSLRYRKHQHLGQSSVRTAQVSERPALDQPVKKSRPDVQSQQGPRHAGLSLEPLPPHRSVSSLPLPILSSGAETSNDTRGSPKRQHLESERNIVPPRDVLAVALPGDMTAEHHQIGVTPDTSLELQNFDFNFGQPGLFAPPEGHDPREQDYQKQHHAQLERQQDSLTSASGYLSQACVPDAVNELTDPQYSQQLQHSRAQGAFPQRFENQDVALDPYWSNQLLHSSQTIPDHREGAYYPPPHTLAREPIPRVSPQQPPSTSQRPSNKRNSGSSQNSSAAPRRKKAKHRSRQIALKDSKPHDASFPLPAGSVRGTDFDLLPGLMAQLSMVQSRLLELSSALARYKSTKQRSQSVVPAADETRLNVTVGSDAACFSVQELFGLTGQVSEILDQLYNAGIVQDESRVMDETDPGNSMFVLSIYVRLLDMYQRVFTLVRSELSQSDANTAFKFWKLPDVSVGSFAVNSSPFLQMSLTMQLAEEFLSRLRASTSALYKMVSRADSGSATGVQKGEEMFAGIVSASFQALQAREESLRKYLSDVRADIEALLDS